jgi:hypothetical protein
VEKEESNSNFIVPLREEITSSFSLDLTSAFVSLSLYIYLLILETLREQCERILIQSSALEVDSP